MVAKITDFNGPCDLTVEVFRRIVGKTVHSSIYTLQGAPEFHVARTSFAICECNAGIFEEIDATISNRKRDLYLLSIGGIVVKLKNIITRYRHAKKGVLINCDGLSCGDRWRAVRWKH